MKVGITLAIAAAALITPVASAQSAFVSKHGIPKHVTKICIPDLVFNNAVIADKSLRDKLEKAKKKLEKAHCIHWVYEPHRKHVITLEPTRRGAVLSHYSLPCPKALPSCPPEVVAPMGLGSYSEGSKIKF